MISYVGDWLLVAASIVFVYYAFFEAHSATLCDTACLGAKHLPVATIPLGEGRSKAPEFTGGAKRRGG